MHSWHEANDFRIKGLASPRAAAATASAGWCALAVAPCELRLRTTLDNGQCFGWHRQPGAENVWVGVVGSKLLALKETESDCHFRCLSGAGEEQDEHLRDELRDFFQLDTPLVPLYEEWSAADARMATVARVLPGMRVLRQEPVECLFSFICSSNNNIGRIGGMLQALRRAYGEPLPAPAGPAGKEKILTVEVREGEGIRRASGFGVRREVRGCCLAVQR